MEELLVRTEQDLFLLADLFDLSVLASDRPVSSPACAALSEICRGRLRALQRVRSHLPVEVLNLEV